MNKYIKMCNCKEIQDIWCPIESDRVHIIQPDGFKFTLNLLSPDICNIVDGRCPSCILSERKILKKKVIWLPRQDQLQDIIINNSIFQDKDVQVELLDFWNGVMALFDSREKYWLQFKSFEQLWLAFVMKEKYNKIWDKSKWIKQ